MMKYFLLLIGSFAVCFDGASAACETNQVELSGRCFFFFPESEIDFVEARSLCQGLGGDLPIVEDCNLLREIRRHIDGLGEFEGYWIGGSDALTEGDWLWADGTSMKMGAPYWGQAAGDYHPRPDITGVNNSCLSMNTDNSFYFTDEDCTAVERSHLCQHSRGGCQPPFETVGEMCIQFESSLQLTWQEAREVCQTNEGDLAIVDDCDLMAQIIDYIIEFEVPAAEGFWIGGSTLDEADVWKWIDATPVSMEEPFWSTADGHGLLQPDDNDGYENCASIWKFHDGFFNDMPCLETAGMRALCEIP